jgi:BolA protein
MTSRDDRIDEILRRAFNPLRLELVNESGKHSSHAKRMGLDGGGETHYKITLVSNTFDGLSRLARSKEVHRVLANEFATGLHSLSLELLTPLEGLSA